MRDRKDDTPQPIDTHALPAGVRAMMLHFWRNRLAALEVEIVRELATTGQHRLDALAAEAARINDKMAAAAEGAGQPGA